MSEADAFKAGSNGIFRSGRHMVMRGVADGIALAATPTFVILAGVTFVLKVGPPDVLCAATQHASPLNDMAMMYALMSVFHSMPWLKLVFGRGNGASPT